MTVWNVWDFRNSINKGKNSPENLLKKRDLCRTINEEYNKGVTTLLPKLHHLIDAYYKKTLFQMKFGRQRDWIKQIQLTREEFASGGQQATQPRARITNLRAWLITGTRNMEEHSDDDDST